MLDVVIRWLQRYELDNTSMLKLPKSTKLERKSKKLCRRWSKQREVLLDNVMFKKIGSKSEGRESTIL